MDTNEFDERNFAKSRAVCEAMAEYYLKDRVYETWYKEESELYKLLDECGSVENIRKRLMPEGMEWPRFDDGELVEIGSEFLDEDGNARICAAIELTHEAAPAPCSQVFSSAFIRWDIYEKNDGLFVSITEGERVGRLKLETSDSWERLEEDCTISERRYYATRIGHDVGLMDDAEIHEAVSRDLVRRAKSLAERERR